MASSARIDELRKKFDENPRRYFAPLANEYRKAGDLDQAVFICQEYLPQQPGHMSGHIVYAQTLFEMGRHDEAKAVFETALSLDPENLIALRHLGDIARQQGDSNAARIWYQRVLEADPRNEEIAQIMISLLAEPDTASRPKMPPPISTPVLTRAVTPPRPAPPAEAAPSWVTDQHDTGLEVEKSGDRTQINAQTPPATVPPQTAPAPSEEAQGGHEWLDLKDLTIGGVPMGTGDEESPTSADSQMVSGPQPTAEVLPASFADAFSDSFSEPFSESFGDADASDESFTESFIESSPEAFTALPEHARDDEAAFDLGREDGPFEADPFAIAATPEKRVADQTPDSPATAEASEKAEPFESGYAPHTGDLSDAAFVGNEVPSSDGIQLDTQAEVDGLEQFEAGFMPPAPPTTPIETASFFDVPPAPVDVPKVGEIPVGFVANETGAVQSDAIESDAVESPSSESSGVESSAAESRDHQSPAITESPTTESPIVESLVQESPAIESSAVETPHVESSAIETFAETPAVEPAVPESAVAEAEVAEPEVAEPEVAAPPFAESTVVESAFVESTPDEGAPAAATPDVVEEPAHVEEAFVTETMAELYLRQGHLESAMDIYRKLVEQRPTDDALRARLHAVETQVFAQHAAPSAAWEAEPPAESGRQAEPEPTATYSGPTIREFLMGLAGLREADELSDDDAGQAVGADQMEPVEAGGGDAEADTAVIEPPLEEVMYGSAHGDVQHSAPAAARRATPHLGKTVTGSIDALFSDADASAADASAATTLADAFAPDGHANIPLQGVPAHRAANELSLDHVFKSNTPPRSDVDTDGFSFDQFFADDMSEPAPNSAGDAGAPSPEATDDIAQFNAWLNGLKKT